MERESTVVNMDNESIAMDSGALNSITNLEDETNLIIKAFNADIEEKNARQCPGCGEIYAQRIGCNYVRCPNLHCNTWFCWNCGSEDITWAHFLVKKCKPGYEDVLKALYPVKFFMLMGLFTTMFITPPIFLILYVFLPLSVTFGAPTYFASLLPTNSVIVKICCFFVLLPVGSLLAVLSVLPITLIGFFYLAIFFVKLIPIFGQVMMLFEFAQYLTSFFGIGDWFEAYKRAEEGRRAERARNRLHRLEQRKRRIKTP